MIHSTYKNRQFPHLLIQMPSWGYWSTVRITWGSLRKCSLLGLSSRESDLVILEKVLVVSYFKSFQERSQDGGGIGRGDHFLSYKFIERTIERWTNFTKQLLVASRGHQTPRKATRCLRREEGQNIKENRGDKRARDGDPSWEGSLNRGSFHSPGNPRTGGSEGSFQVSEGNLTGRKN